MDDSRQTITFYILVICFGGFLFLKYFGGIFGITYSDGKQGKIVVIEMPEPKSPSTVFGIGAAMAKGQPILIFRQTRKASSLPFNARNFFFISKLMESYAPEVKVIELANSVSYPNGDYFMTIMDNFPGNGYGVLKKENDNYRLYTSVFGYSEVYDEMVIPVKESIEEVLGPAKFDKKKLISKTSKYKDFIKARDAGENIILYSFANACSNLPPGEQKQIEATLKTKFAKQTTIIKVDPKAFLDPANELYSKCESIVSVYNGKTKEIYPAFFPGQSVTENVQTALNKR